jgi:hypothetical protein
MNRAKFQALWQGALFGIPLGALLMLNEALALAVDPSAFELPRPTGALLLSYATMTLCLLAYTFTSWRASYVTSRFSTGMPAGLVTGAVSSIINSAGVSVIWLIHLDTIAGEAQAGSAVKFTTDRVLSQRVAELNAGLALAIVFGLLCGAFGGKISKERKGLAQAPAVQAS